MCRVDHGLPEPFGATDVNHFVLYHLLGRFYIAAQQLAALLN